MNTIEKYAGTTRPLSEKRRMFALHLASGLPQTEAYRKAFQPKGSYETTRVAACRMAKDPRIKAEVAKLQEQLRNHPDPATMMERVEKRRILADIARDTKADARKRIAAIEVDNQMTGENAPQQVEVFGVGNLLAMIRQRTAPTNNG